MGVVIAMERIKIAKYLGSGMVLLLFCSTAFAVTAVVGTVKKIDNAARTIVVKAADGTEHAFRFVGQTTVHGAEKVAVGAKDSYHGLKEGSEVVVHYTVKGSEEIAEEIDQIGRA